MFNNFINLYEFIELCRQVRHGRLPVVFSRFFTGKKGRTKKAWSRTKDAPRNWLNLPVVEARRNHLITGNKAIDYREYIQNKYLAEQQSLIGLSLACGTGRNELRWIKSGKFKRIDAYDLSKPRIKYAQNAANENGYGDIINYYVGDVYDIQLVENFYDIILAEMALHHFTPLKEIFLRISKTLKPDGYFIVNEYVGPTRLQWPKRQLEIVNGLLNILPEKYRIQWDTGFVKKKVFSQSVLRMLLSDPSEGVESAKILPFLHQLFEVVEIRKYGGTILHPLLANIAHNFLSNDDETQRYLQLCFDAEDALLKSKEIESDFIITVCTKKT
jgi:ubiquinone/menaquinone biosynthesis C-methylase UbiE